MLPKELLFQFFITARERPGEHHEREPTNQYRHLHHHTQLKSTTHAKTTQANTPRLFLLPWGPCPVIYNVKQ